MPAAYLHLKYKQNNGVSFRDAAWLPGSVFSLFSVLNILLVFFLGKKWFGRKDVALFAAFLMACANSMFYPSRHTFPYDASMMFILAAALVGIGGNPSWRRNVSVGLLAGVAVQIYLGHAFFIAFLLGSLSCQSEGFRVRIHRLACYGIGIALPLLVLTCVSACVGQEPLYPRQVLAFAGTITQGDFSEGWRVPFAYLWHTEHLLALVWLVGAALAVRHARRPLRTSILILLVPILLTYFAYVINSVVLEKQVVYGRLTRPFVPLLCLAAAGGFWRATQAVRWRKGLLLAGTVVLLIHTAWTFAGVYKIQFPYDVWKTVAREYCTVLKKPPIAGSLPGSATLPHCRYPGGDPDQHPRRFILTNAWVLYPVVDRSPDYAGRVLLRVEHPLKYRPFQYEGFTPLMRDILQNSDISIKLIDPEPAS